MYTSSLEFFPYRIMSPIQLLLLRFTLWCLKVLRTHFLRANLIRSCLKAWILPVLDYVQILERIFFSLSAFVFFYRRPWILVVSFGPWWMVGANCECLCSFSQLPGDSDWIQPFPASSNGRRSRSVHCHLNWFGVIAMLKLVIGVRVSRF